MKQHKIKLIEEKVKLKETQKEFGQYWKQQSEWRQNKRNEMNSQPYNPEDVWNVEGPTRRRQEEAKRQKDMENLKNTLDQQADFYRSA